MPPDADRLEARLVEIVGAGQVDAGPFTAAFAVDGVIPRLVVRPGSQDEVAAVVGACRSAGAALVCRGAGAAMSLGNAPSGLHVVLSLDRVARIVEVDASNLNVSAEAGVRLPDLQVALAAKGVFLPIDPPQADRVTVGGLVAANASGPSRLLYGTVRDWLLGLRVVLPDGTRTRCGGKVVKNVSGYDMNKLFIGSLGTLGVVTEATFRLLPSPAARATAVGVFSRVEDAATVVARTLESQLLPAALEALDAQALGALAGQLGMPGARGVALAVALEGSREAVGRQLRDFQRFFTESAATSPSTLDAERSAVAWRAIRDVHADLKGTAEERTVVKIAVPIARTMGLFAAAAAVAERGAWTGAVTAHAGSGVVRASYVVDPGALDLLRREVEDLRGEAEGAQGSLVVEAAPLALKRQLDAWGQTGDALRVMRSLKAEFDPGGLMSPGRFLGGM